MSTEKKVEKEEAVKPEEEVAEVPEVQPVDVEEAEAEMVEVEEEAPTEEEVAEEKPPVEALPNIFVADSSTPPRSLTGPRILYVVDEKKGYPMSNEVNAWVREHDIPIKVPTPEIEAKMKELGIEGQSELPDLAQLTKKLEA